ncbi:MAG TPA: hypothetical protein VGY54_13950 [Polyangiaceae bacterium]|nr:hypothetical protein [Polyangiaceae bacterium]
MAALAALACSIPATTRVSGLVSHLHGPARVWIALAAVALLPMLIAILVLRAARQGLRAFGGAGWELRAYGVVLWLASLLVELSLFGRLLRATTHNHALAGVAFALGALAMATASALLCARVVTLLNRGSMALRLLLGGFVSFGVLGAYGLVLLGFSRAASHDEASAAAIAVFVDTLSFALGAVLALFVTEARGRALARRRALALVGPPIALVIGALGLSILRDGALSRAIGERAPLFALVAHWMYNG